MKPIVRFVLIALLALFASAATAQPVQRAYLPLVATTTPSVTTLISSDTTMVAAYVVPGTERVLVTYIDRAHGNRLHVTEDMGDRLVELPLPPELGPPAGAAFPSFTAPGDKQANGATVVIRGILKVYVTTRDIGDATGPFKLKRLDMVLPPRPNP